MIVEINRLMHYSLRAAAPKRIEGGMGEGRGGLYLMGHLATSRDIVGCHLRNVLLSSSG